VNSPDIGSVLSSLRELEATLVRVNRLAALQRIYAVAVAADLARRSRVTLERSGTLVVVADTSAIAAKLKQLAPRIVQEIVKSAPEVTSIQVEAQVPLGSDLGARSRPKIGPRGLTSLGELRDALPDSPLRQALDRMVRRSISSHREDKPLKGQESQNGR
jgi:Dna[CI] antecedent, DciA